HQEIDQNDLRTAREWLQSAHTVCFLGFGYHHLTLDRLGISSKLTCARIWGTTMGLSGPELARIEKRFGNKGDVSLRLDQTRKRDARAYLREEHVLQAD